MAKEKVGDTILPLLNRLIDVVVVYGADHHYLQKSNREDKTFGSLLEWTETCCEDDAFTFNPQLLGTVSPLAACFAFEKNPIKDYPFIEVIDDFNEKKMCISKDRVHTLSRLVFPDGAQVLHKNADPLVLSSRLTDMYGKKSYCTGITFYREYTLRDHQLVPSAGGAEVKPLSPGLPQALFVPMSVAVISQTPCYNMHNKLLSCFHNQLEDPLFQDFWSKLVDFSQRIFTIPIPPPGSLEISFKMYQNKYSWLLNPPDPNTPFGESSQLDIRLHFPFLCLTHQNVLKVLTAILTGRNIIFVSSHYTLLTFVIECMFHYISPLEWRYTTITTLGSFLLDLLETPGAYIYGIHTQSLDDPRVKDVSGVVWVFLDEGRVNSDLTQDAQIPFLPADAQAKFISRYMSLQTNPDIWMTEVPALLTDDKLIEWRREFEAEYDHQLTDAFLDLMVDLLGELFLFKVNGGANIRDWSGFQTCSSDDQFFYEELWKADLWLNLFQQRATRLIRDQFTIRVDALRKPVDMNAQSRGRASLSDVRPRTTGPPSKRSSMSLNLSSSQISETSWSFRSASAGGPRMRLLLPDYTHKKAEYFQQVLESIEDILNQLQKDGGLRDSRQNKILAPLYFLQGCYLGTLRKLLESIDSFDKTERYMVGVRLSKGMLTYIMKEMKEAEREQFKEMACFPEFNKILQDYRLARLETPSDIRYGKLDRNPLSLEKFKHRLKEHGVSRDIDTQLKVFNILSQKHGTVKSEVFHEFLQHWNAHKKETEDFKLPGCTLWKKNHSLPLPVPVKEKVLLINNSQCRTSSGSGPLVLTTYRLLVLSKSSIHEVFDLRKLVKLKIHDLDHHAIWSSPAISELVEREDYPANKAQKPGWYIAFPRQLVESRNFWHSMMTELMLGYQLSIKRKSPELMEQAQITVLITQATIRLLHSEDQAKQKRTISKLQNFAKKDESIQTQRLPGLKYRLNPSLEEADKRTIECSLYIPPHREDGEGHGKLWLGLGSGLLKVYDLETRSPEAYVKVTDCYHRKGSRLSCLLRVGDTVWAGSLNKTIYIMNYETCCVESRLSHLADDVRDLALDEENNVVWSLMLLHTRVMAWDPVQKESIQTIKVDDCQQCKCLAVYKKQLWIGTSNGISVFDKEKGSCLKRIVVEGSPLDVRCIAVSSTDDVWCSSSQSNGPILVYDANSFELKYSVPEQKFRVNVLLNVDDTIWCGTNRGKIIVYCAKTFEKKCEMDAHGDAIRTMITDAHGSVISGCASRDGTAAIWDSSLRSE